jgi:hypothetical protein
MAVFDFLGNSTDNAWLNQFHPSLEQRHRAIRSFDESFGSEITLFGHIKEVVRAPDFLE